MRCAHMRAPAGAYRGGRAVATDTHSNPTCVALARAVCTGPQQEVTTTHTGVQPVITQLRSRDAQEGRGRLGGHHSGPG